MKREDSKKYYELRKAATLIRRKFTKNYGFRQYRNCNWIIKSGYFFYLDHSLGSGTGEAKLYAKPLYVDDLLDEISNDPKAPQSRRIYGVSAKQIAEYDFLPGDFRQYSVEDIENVWPKIFSKALEDIDRFIAENPDPEKIVPEEDAPDDRDHLFYFMYLIHHGQGWKVIKKINELRAQGYMCTVCFYTLEIDMRESDSIRDAPAKLSEGVDIYDDILKYLTPKKKFLFW